ncbi:unnamed protein product [Moneuplotes crassus]|uniref:Uncharacterized protein n=1 Tax=Euplotes crassus TaxID=5936 RepID=A0AAD1U920_EUPCR|nr:unnamed protein product [Moneuplotes crassus]
MDSKLMGKNMPLEEYLALLDQQNKAKKAKEASDKSKILKKELEEREKGFNVFISGANQERADAANRKIKAKDASKSTKVLDQPPRRKWEPQSSQSSFGKPPDDQYMNPFEHRSNSFLSSKTDLDSPVKDAPKVRKKWDKKTKNAFDYDNDENDFLEDLGFHKDDGVEDSISKFSSHVAYNNDMPRKSDLCRTDSNVISEEGLDSSSNNVSVMRQTDRIPTREDIESSDNEEEDMEKLVMNASNAELEFMRQSLSNFQELMARETQEINNFRKETTPRIDENEHESDEDYNDDFEPADEDSDEEPQKDVYEIKSGSADSIEEELDIENDEDDTTNPIDNTVDEIQRNKISSMKPPTSSAKRAVSAQYQLRSLKPGKPKTTRFNNYEKSQKNTVIKALMEENEKFGIGEPEKRMKAQTKESRPFSTLMSREKQLLKTERNQEEGKYEDIKLEINDETSNTDFERESLPSSRHRDQKPTGGTTLLESDSKKLEILHKIERLSETQRAQLFLLLEHLEKGSLSKLPSV